MVKNFVFFLSLVLLSRIVPLNAADMRMSVAQLTEFVRSEISMKHPDKQLADFLKHVRLTNRLDDNTIEELQGLGAGPKTVAVMRDLKEASANLAAQPPMTAKAKAAPIPPPDSIEQGRIISDAHEYALNYTKQLPNYICAQVTKRLVDPTGTDNNWRTMDKIMIRLSYYDGKEDYKVALVNDVPAGPDMTFEKLGGTVSQGEFASMMLDIFREDSHARFDWDHWATLRGRRCWVFSYDIEQVNSRYHIVADRTQDYVPAYRGLIYIDTETKFITRIVMTPYGIPPGFPIQNVKTELDYGYAKVGDGEYLLPLKSVVSSRGGRYLTKNENEFRMYRKFGTDSTIKFDSPEVTQPLSDDKTTEKPIKPE